MKKAFKISILIGFSLCTLFSCKKSSDFLDQRQTEELTEQSTFTDSINTLKFLNNIYSEIGQDINPNRSANAAYNNGFNTGDLGCLEDLTTNSVLYYDDPQLAWLTGKNNPTNAPFLRYWPNFYNKIRACNKYMINVQNSPLSAGLKKRTTAEARFLRAFYYSQLIRVFGAVQLVGDTPLTSTDFKAKRNTLKECVDFIASQCDAAAKDLPNAAEQASEDYGRITKGASLALKARMLLMAASPLYNGQTVSGAGAALPLLSYSQTYNASLWKTAADAFKAVIDLNAYSLYEDNTTRPGHGFWKVFLMRKNPEYILPFMVANGTALEGLRFPRSRGGGNPTSWPSQNLVDAFNMKNGKPITDPASGYKADSPYVNRDPRFYYSVIYNKSTVYLTATRKKDPVDIYTSLDHFTTSDGVGHGGTETGYYCLKMANDSTATSAAQSRVYPLIRYAEMLLGYAEALNEYQGPTTEVYQQITTLRKRAGIEPGANNMYGLTPGMTKEQMRTVIQNEYNVELAFEGHRYYDVRRWKIAPVTEGQPVLGMQVTQQKDKSFTYKTFIWINAIFQNPKMYFQPVPLSEVNKSSEMIQNPGW